ncbi:MAG TPA: hypothetical protein VJ654_20980 [Noviherbaspirillum sp.]|nr:hypothetical protein [Noviherbaspirillum sp.]
MKRSVSLLLFFFTAFAHAAPVDAALFDERVRIAKSAESDERFRSYPKAMFKRASRELARTMRRCMATSSKPKSQPFVLVADISAAGKAEAIEVKPDNELARCFSVGFAAASYLKPPEYVDGEGFPITMRVAP